MNEVHVTSSKLTPDEDRILTVFGGWLAAHFDSEGQVIGLADLFDRFERELPDDWRELAGGIEG